MMVIGERKSSVGASVNASGIYRAAHARVINGTRYSFVHTVRANGQGRIEVYRADEINPCKLFSGKVREMPGMMVLSARLGKLLSF